MNILARSSANRSVLQAFLVALLLTASALALSACNTARGFGQDVEAAGDSIEDTAEDVAD